MERSALDLQLSEEQAMLRDTVRSFAAEHVAPAHEKLDHAGVHPTEVVAGMAELGLFGILAPSDVGGVGMGMLAHVVALEELAAAGGLTGAILCAHGIGLDALVGCDGGRHLAPSLIDGTSFASPAFDPRPSSHDVAAAVSGNEMRLSGEKIQVPFPGRAGAYLVVVPAGEKRSLFFVAGDAKGVRHEGRDEALGMLGFETASLVMRDVPAARLGGDDVVDRVMASARLQVAAVLTGIGRGAILHAVRYAHERKQFDRPLVEFMAIQERLARGAARIESARALVHGAARLRDLGEPYAAAAAKARLVAAEAAMLAADDGLQVFGGYGYSREYPAERFYRDARFVGFGEGDPGSLMGDIARDLG